MNMRGNQRVAIRGCGVLLGLLLIAGAAAAQTEIKTQTADLRSDSMSFNWTTNEMVFIGNASVNIANGHHATLTAPKLTVKLSDKGDRVIKLVAAGPVRMEIIGAADPQGVKARIVATAADRAEYSETTQKIVLYGDAQADYVSLPEGPDSRRAHFTGDIMEADLNTSLLTVTKAHLQVSSPLAKP
ncbi:MAG TPA: LptA/OstA family protein [Armatimonadota bacterium]|jgi:lipopolysaccharide export system protein LptA